MKKAYVLDTNVLVHDYKCLEKFEDNEIYLPFTVLEELDGLKKGLGETAFAARSAIRLIDSYASTGDLQSGVATKGGGILRVVQDADACCTTRDSADNLIISTAKSLEGILRIKASGIPVILVSKDSSVRIKANFLGLKSQNYKNDESGLYDNYGKVLGENDYQNGIHSVRYTTRADGKIYRLTGKDKCEPIKLRASVSGITPNGIEQQAALDALLSDNIDCIAIRGRAGSGKTLLALAAGLQLMERKNNINGNVRAYEQIIVGRPVVPLGAHDIGFLPGDVAEKMDPWMAPIYDNLEVIVGTPKETKDKKTVSRYKNYEYLLESGIIQIQALSYLRGRSMSRKYIIIDEAQNTTPLDIKTIVTRCGQGSKIILVGDTDQIDTPYLDSKSNGLSYLVNRFINYERFCYLYLPISVRSELANVAAELL